MKGRAVAIITARGGSKRIPRKNVKEFAGHPIIKYSIDAAIAAGCFDEIMVSTDDSEIAETAEKCGAKIPFMRSAETSGDFATTADVVLEVLSEYAKRGVQFEWACCIYPTAPFISAEKIKRGFEILKRSGSDSVVPIMRFSYPIQRAFKMENGKLSMIWPENRDKRSQDLLSAYHDAGQFYWTRVTAFLAKKNLFTDNTMGLEIPESEVQDIDSQEDWTIAELKYKILKNIA